MRDELRRYYAAGADIVRLEGKTNNLENVITLRLGALLVIAGGALFGRHAVLVDEER